MGSINQLLFIQQRSDRLRGPYLEAGAKDYGNTQDLRSIFAKRGDYVGVDLEAGPDVDLVIDLAGPFEKIEAAIGGIRFGTIFCLSVLEHCEQPFAMAENLTRLLADGATICISAPFAFRVHAYPVDYWRFTPEGIRKLFPKINFPPEDSAWTTQKQGEFNTIDKDIAKIQFSASAHWKRRRIMRGISAKTLKTLARCGILGWLAGHRYVLAPTDILMIGTRKKQ